jgi:PadR family transcriptional regulator PadR
MTLRRTPQTSRLLTTLMAAPELWRYGYDLSRDTTLKSGTLYPILARLEEQHLLDTRWEPSPAGRPPRHMYRLRPGTIPALRLWLTPATAVPALQPAFAN